MGLILSSDILTASTCTANPAGSASWPATNLISYKRRPVVRAARSVDISVGQIWTVDLGSAKAFTHILTLGANVTSLIYEWSTDGSTGWTALAGSPRTIAQNPYSGYYNDIFAESLTKRYLRVRTTNGQAVVSGTQYSIGSLLFINTTVETDWNQSESSPVRDNTKYFDSGDDIVRAGPFQFIYEWSTVYDSTNAAKILQIMRDGRDRPIVVWDKSYGSQYVMLARPHTSVTHSRKSITIDSSLSWREMV